MKGIAELLAILECAKHVSVCGAGISSDGKIGIADIKYVVELIKQYEDFSTMIKGFKETLPEAKDIDAAEATQLVAKIFEIVKAVKDELAKE